MLLQRILDRMTTYVVSASAVLSGLCFLVGGLRFGIGALTGGLFGTANFLLLRWFGLQLVKASERGRLLWGSLLMVKMTAVLGAAWAVLATGWVEPAGFAVGLGGLVFGVLGGGFHVAATGELDEDEGADSDGEES